MGTVKSRMKKVAPVTDKEREDPSISESQWDGSRLFGPSNRQTSERRFSVRRRVQSDCNSEGQDSEFSAEDLGDEMDRILAECDLTLNRTSHKMPKTTGLYNAKIQVDDQVYSGRRTHEKNKVNPVNKPTSNVHEKVRPPKEMSCANPESPATAQGYGIDGGSFLSFPIIYDASEEDLMNTIERDFS